MTKNLKLTYILVAVASAIIMAWRTLSNFFGGVGINFVAMLIIVAFLVLIMLTDKFVFNRTKDLLIAAFAFAALELIVYFGLEFVVDSYSHVGGFLVYQNVLSILSIFYFAYIAFRFITEFKGIKLGFIEFMLGNERPAKKPKKDKELVNGTLEEKPNAIREEIVETEENIEVVDAETNEEI